MCLLGSKIFFLCYQIWDTIYRVVHGKFLLNTCGKSKSNLGVSGLIISTKIFQNFYISSCTKGYRSRRIKFMLNVICLKCTLSNIVRILKQLTWKNNINSRKRWKPKKDYLILTNSPWRVVSFICVSKLSYLEYYNEDFSYIYEMLLIWMEFAW